MRIPCSSFAAGPPAADARDGPGRLARDLDAIVAAGPTAALAEVSGPAGAERAAAGVIRIGRPAPALAGGRFRIGSTTKAFVATVVLQLVAELRLRLDDTVAVWLPGVVPGGNRITVRQLLNHTSGLVNYTDGMDLTAAGWLRQRFRSWQPAELVALATAQPPLFEPGGGWAYSNTNYVLLGMVVEAVTGQNHATEIERRIIRPLGLRHTESPGERVTIGGPHAHGYLPVGPEGSEKPVDVTRMNASVAGAAGDMISTTADLNTFFHALLTGRLLPPAQLSAMTTMVPGHNYGLGLESTTLSCGVTLLGHGGGTFGYATGSFHTPDGRLHLSMSVNRYLGDPSPFSERMINRIFRP